MPIWVPFWKNGDSGEEIKIVLPEVVFEKNGGMQELCR